MSWLYWGIPLIIVFGLALLSPFWFGLFRGRRHEENEQAMVAHNRRLLAGRNRARRTAASAGSTGPGGATRP